MTAEKEQEMMTVLAPLIAILTALARTHPDRQALAEAYDDAAEGLRKALSATWTDSALQQLQRKLDDARVIVTPGINAPANTSTRFSAELRGLGTPLDSYRRSPWRTRRNGRPFRLQISSRFSNRPISTETEPPLANNRGSSLAMPALPD